MKKKIKESKMSNGRKGVGMEEAMRTSLFGWLYMYCMEIINLT
jgi:hypothetical protein